MICFNKNFQGTTKLWGAQKIWGYIAPECQPVATGLICTLKAKLIPLRSWVNTAITRHSIRMETNLAASDIKRVVQALHIVKLPIKQLQAMQHTITIKTRKLQQCRKNKWANNPNTMLMLSENLKKSFVFQIQTFLRSISWTHRHQPFACFQMCSV